MFRAVSCYLVTNGASSAQHKGHLSTLRPTTGEIITDERRYDLVVIGGGSGGIACAKEAARLGAKVAVLDFVKPSIHGTTWGLGGTCVNVGCIPKKLMHEAAKISNTLRRGTSVFGLESTHSNHNWPALVQTVQDHIHSLNFQARVGLLDENVHYINDLGRFIDGSTIELVHATEKNASSRFPNKQQKSTISADAFVVAVGGRPKALDIPGGDEAITSDDLFSRSNLSNGTTGGNTVATPRVLVIGGSYVALECAGILNSLGADVTCLHRSILLRGFDRECSERVGAAMFSEGSRFISGTPTSITRLADGKLLVAWNSATAVGRKPDTGKLGLKEAGVETDGDGKIICDSDGVSTSSPRIFAIGDVVSGAPELTPVAIKSGHLLARRLFTKTSVNLNDPAFERARQLSSVPLVDFSHVCTTVFTPLEYACCGLSEETARKEHGDARIIVYKRAFMPLVEAPLHGVAQGFCKAVVLSPTVGIDGKAVAGAVVGLHYLGPNAGEIMQGFGVAMRMGMTLDDLQGTVGIHPTTAEEIVRLREPSKPGDGPPTVDGC